MSSPLVLTLRDVMKKVVLQPHQHDFVVETVMGLSIWVYCNAHPVRQDDISESSFLAAVGEQARNLLD